MACAHPVIIHIKGENYSVPCRQCMPCRISYQEQIIFSATREIEYAYKSGLGATFCCFTYSDENLPSNGSLKKDDYRLFIKRMRSALHYKSIKHKFKHIGVGEYGGKYGRAHYHAIIIGLTDAETIYASKKCWKNEKGNPLGLLEIEPLGRGGLRYVIKYCTKQIKGKMAKELYDDNQIERPFMVRSVKMGYKWLNDNINNLTDNNYMYIKNGAIKPIPSYYRKIIDKNKNFQSLDYLKATEKVANILNMSLSQYMKYTSRNMEKMLIDGVRKEGLPVDQSDYNKEGGIILQSGLINQIENILDPIPF